MSWQIDLNVLCLMLKNWIISNLDCTPVITLSGVVNMTPISERRSKLDNLCSNVGHSNVLYLLIGPGKSYIASFSSRR